MAEEAKRNVKYNNLVFSEDFIGFSSKYADAYAQYKNMNPALLQAFMKALLERHARMLNGEDGYVDEDQVIHTGIFTGREKKDGKNWLGLDRDSFNASREVNNYLMGMAGKVLDAKAKVAERAKLKSSESPSWVKHSNGNSRSTLAKLISDATGPDLSAWADLVLDFEDENGIRPITKRRADIRRVLSEYATALENGVYGDINDLDRKTELEYILAILKDEEKDPKEKDPRITEALYRRLLSSEGYDKLFFTGKKYQTEEQAKAAAEEAEADNYVLLENEYVLGKNPNNPYNANGSAEERAAYLRTEERRREYLEWERLLEFNNMPYDSYVPESPTFRTSLYSIAEPSIYDNVLIADLLPLIQRAENLKTDDEGYDVYDKNYFSLLDNPDWSGYGENDKNESLEYLSPYFNALGFEPDDVYNNEKAKTNSALLGQYALSMIYNKMGSGNLFNLYRLSNGDYLIPELIDWDTKKAYTISLNGNKAKLNTINIGQLIKDLAQDNPLRLLLENLWRKYKGYSLRQITSSQLVPSAAEGRKLTLKEKENLALPGAPTVYLKPTVLELPAISNADLEYYDAAIGRGTRGLQRWIEGLRAPESFSDFTITENMRVAAAAADITGAIAAWVPGYGTAASAALGLGSTGANLWADWTDESVSGMDMAKDLGLNLVFDVAGLFSGVGMGAKGAKVLNSLRKFGPKIIKTATVLFGGVTGGKQVIEALNKALNSNEKLTVEDWKKVAYGLSALAGISRVGASAMKTRRFRNRLLGEAITERAYVNSKGLKVSDAEVKKVQQAKTKEAYEQAYESTFGKKPDEGGFVRGRGNRATNIFHRFRNNIVPDLQVIPTSNAASTFEARQLALTKALADELALLKSHPIMRKFFNTDLDIHARLTGAFRHPYSEKRGTRRNLQGELDAEKQLNEESIKKLLEAEKSKSRKHKTTAVRERQLISEVNLLLESRGSEKIKDRKAFIDYVRKNIKAKKLKELKAEIENLSAEDLVKLRESFKFKEGGKVAKLYNGNWLKRLGKELGSANRSMDLIETGKLIYANDVTRRNALLLKDVPTLQYSPGNDMPNTISTDNVDAPYNSMASQTLSTAGNLANLYSTSELLVAAKLAGNKLAMQYRDKGAEVLRELMAKANEANLKIALYNNKVHNEVANLDALLLASKRASDADITTKKNQFINGQVLKYLETVSLGLQSSMLPNWEVNRSSTLNKDTQYLRLRAAYDLAKLDYSKDPKNEDYKKALEETSKALNAYIPEFNRRYETENPRPSTHPFGHVLPGYIWPGEFQTYTGDAAQVGTGEDEVLSKREGGSIGKMTQAELVKLFRDRERRKFKDRESLRKYMDKFSERMHRANNSIAYQAYIKLLNSK